MKTPKGSRRDRSRVPSDWIDADDVDPRSEREERHPREKRGWLAKQGLRSLRATLAAAADERIWDIEAVEVEEVAGGASLRVIVRSPREEGVTLELLRGIAPRVRSDLSRIIARKRVPEVTFAWLPSDPVGSGRPKSPQLSGWKAVGAPIAAWLADPVDHEVRRSIEALRQAPDVAQIAVMPDVHLSRGVCVGTVLATRTLVYPQAIGGDIGCGISAVALDVTADLLPRSVAERAFAGVARAVPVLRHVHRNPRAEQGPSLNLRDLEDEPLKRIVERDGFIQFGTLGRGNHFLEVQADPEGRLWLCVHSGSRAVGQFIADTAAREAVKGPAGLVTLDAISEQGRRYLSRAAWAVRYASANRREMITRAAEVLAELTGACVLEDTWIETCHNFVALETHEAGTLLVHRKGASPANAGQLAVIPGSMGGATFHVRGRGNAESLRTSSHGAGRVLSRSQARQRLHARDFKRALSHLVYDEGMARALTDESPDAYRDIHRVMAAQRDLVTIVRRLRPILCLKGS